MPIYEYFCNKCGKNFDYLALKASDPDPSCVICGASEVKKLMSAPSFRPEGIPTGKGGFAGPKCGSSSGG